MVAGIYLLKDKDYFLRLANKALHLLLGQKTHGILREILFDIDSVISSFLRGVFVDSVIVAFLSSLALSIIGIDFAVFIGCFAGLANVIPYFGPVIGIIPAALAGLAEGGIYKAILSAASLFAVQQIECNFIYPQDHRPFNRTPSAVRPYCRVSGRLLRRTALDGSGRSYCRNSSRINL